MAIEERIKACIGQAIFNQLVLSEQLEQATEKVVKLEQQIAQAAKAPEPTQPPEGGVSP